MLNMPPPMSTKASAPSFIAESQPVTGSCCTVPPPPPLLPAPPPPPPAEPLPPAVPGCCCAGEFCGPGDVAEGDEPCGPVNGPVIGPLCACDDVEDDDECELMRKATLANATVNTMSSAKRSASIRTPAPRTDKLHHMAAMGPRTSAACQSAVDEYALRK